SERFFQAAVVEIVAGAAKICSAWNWTRSCTPKRRNSGLSRRMRRMIWAWLDEKLANGLPVVPLV
ncbi:MAG: hypothetical protein ABF504_08680, partial [Komagataeibacter saccharivorans]|uniref:hypothetical protein n=1 Tax=Komagataeibacter saccharivorans TaxID=265959 RepID=UPI0039EC288C